MLAWVMNLGFAGSGVAEVAPDYKFSIYRYAAGMRTLLMALVRV